MKLHVWPKAPNPRRVLLFLAEKGLEISTVDVGGEGGRLSPEYLERYPIGLVPMLELDDGTQIGEAMAICRYLERLHPDPPLLGADPREEALVDMWERRAYEEGLVGAAEVFRNTHPAFADRGLPGSAEPIPQVPELAERGRQRLASFYRRFDAQLADRPFMVGERYTVADATTLATVDFAAFVKCPIPESCANLRRWHAEVSSRPSARAW